MKEKKIALIGNPNVGKSTLFNLLTGLSQKVGNYPGMTVEKKTGTFISGNTKFHLIDLPGIYGIYPSSLDEQVVVDVLNDTNHPNHPELTIVVGEPGNLKGAVFLFKQIRDLGIPTLFVLNMMDEAEKNGIEINQAFMNEKLNAEIVYTDARSGRGIKELKDALINPTNPGEIEFSIPREYRKAVDGVLNLDADLNTYRAWQLLAQQQIKNLPETFHNKLTEIKQEYKIIPKRLQVRETVSRYEKIKEILEHAYTKKEKKPRSKTETLDWFLIHPFLGYLVFLGLLLLIFQAVFAWSGPFMDGIDSAFAWMNKNVGSALPEGPLSSL